MKKITFLNYASCSTCRKAKKWLEENQIHAESRPILEQNPTAEELTQWTERSGMPAKKFFNTSGQLYKEMHLKDRLPGMSESEQIALLASNGKLVKRPLIITEDTVLFGFKPELWEKLK